MNLIIEIFGLTSYLGISSADFSSQKRNKEQ